MAQIKKNETFVDGELVTGLRLNNIIDLAELNPEAITDQDPLATSFDVQSVDLLLMWDSSESDLTKKLKKVSIDDIMRSGQVVKFQSISGVSGSDLAVSIAGGQSFVVNGNTNISGNLTGTGLIQGATGKFTTELTIPSGTTGTRPASPITGSTRFNTTTGFTEIYNGTSWVNSDITPSNNTFTGNNTFSKELDSTGSFKLNDRVGFSLYQIYEEAIPNVSTWTSSTFTKPIDEMWVFEVDTLISGSGTLAYTNNAGVQYNVSSISGAVSNYNSCTKWVVNIGTALVSENVKSSGLTIGMTSPAGAANKFRIYKYKTAIGMMVTGKSYINNGSSVTVTSTSHGLTAGTTINIFADKSTISGLYTISTAATDTFTFANSATAGSGTLAYIA